MPEKTNRNTPLLDIRNLSRHFGGLKAVDGVSFQVNEGEIVGLIGPNGAGKTTLFNLISGFLKPTAGEIYFRGLPIHGKRPNAIARLGVGRTFQIVKPFGELSVRDNVLAGMGHNIYPSLQAFLHVYHTPTAIARANDILENVGLAAYADARADTLPIGLQRRLEIARALALSPILLLLDESAAGLTHQEAEDLAALIRDLRDRGITILLVEHNMRFAMNLCERIVVLNQGRILAEGTPEEIQTNPAVIEAYLGHSGVVRREA
ncbi:MAG: ABC transporter ATP-binding protein [Chloroflexi bacterium]|nr:ABC transporter ATP-binding protein [Chloroflexota bacterium]